MRERGHDIEVCSHKGMFVSESMAACVRMWRDIDLSTSARASLYIYIHIFLFIIHLDERP